MPQPTTTQPSISPTHIEARPDGARSGRHLCPWWIGYLLASPLRRLVENPDRLLAPHVRPGMAVVDLGSGMGFWSLPAARLVGHGGRVIAVDVQERMLRGLQQRAKRGGVEGIIETRLASQHDLGLSDLEGCVDFVLAVHVLHETTDEELTLRQCHAALRRGGHMLLAEPRGHVSPAAFALTVEHARAAGFVAGDARAERRNLMVLLEKPA